MENFCVIETGGKQYKVKEGDKIKVEKLDGEEKEKVEFDKVLLSYKNNSLKIGTPYLEGEKVIGEIVAQKRDKKKIVFKYHSKTRYRKLKGHRQLYTEVIIQKI